MSIVLFTICNENTNNHFADVAIGDVYQGEIIFYILTKKIMDIKQERCMDWLRQQKIKKNNWSWVGHSWICWIGLLWNWDFRSKWNCNRYGSVKHTKNFSWMQRECNGSKTLCWLCSNIWSNLWWLIFCLQKMNLIYYTLRGM